MHCINPVPVQKQKENTYWESKILILQLHQSFQIEIFLLLPIPANAGLFNAYAKHSLVYCVKALNRVTLSASDFASHQWGLWLINILCLSKRENATVNLLMKLFPRSLIFPATGHLILLVCSKERLKSFLESIVIFLSL